MVSRRSTTWVIAMLLVLAFLAVSVVTRDIRRTGAILAGMGVSATLVMTARHAFGRIEALRNPCLYYFALLISLGTGFLVYILLAPVSQFSSWGIRLLASIIASISIVCPYIVLARLVRANILPWERGEQQQAEKGTE